MMKKSVFVWATHNSGRNFPQNTRYKGTLAPGVFTNVTNYVLSIYYYNYILSTVIRRMLNRSTCSG